MNKKAAHEKEPCKTLQEIVASRVPADEIPHLFTQEIRKILSWYSNHMIIPAIRETLARQPPAFNSLKKSKTFNRKLIEEIHTQLKKNPTDPLEYLRVGLGIDTEGAFKILKKRIEKNKNYQDIAILELNRLSTDDEHLGQVRFLITSGIPINELRSNVDNWARTPLMNAALNGARQIVKILVEAGADEALIDEEGKMAIDHAQLYRYKYNSRRFCQDSSTRGEILKILKPKTSDFLLALTKKRCLYLSLFPQEIFKQALEYYDPNAVIFPLRYKITPEQYLYYMRINKSSLQ